MAGEPRGPVILVDESGLRVAILWSDSLGAKSFSTLVECGGTRLIIDPGAAAMHPGYPAPDEEKRRLRRLALEVIAGYVGGASLVIITHYHYDHYVRPWDPEYRGPDVYSGRTVYMKNPNVFINESQRSRAEKLLEHLMKSSGCEPSLYTSEPGAVEPPDYESMYPRAAANNKPSRLEAGRSWLRRLAGKWLSWRWYRERIRCGRLDLHLVDEGLVEEGYLRVRLLGPHFHGDVYERTGWVVPVLVEACGRRILYTSDLMGPVIEEYVDEVVSLKPDIILADGPATYLPPRSYPRHNVERAVENMIRVMRETLPALIVWDHHLPREPRWRERVARVFREAARLGVRLETTAGIIGLPSHVELAASSSS